jgi:Cu/Ag efflux protein CusF
VKSFFGARKTRQGDFIMMKKLLVLACTLAIGTAAAAAPAKAAPAKTAHFAGTIQKYDAGTKDLTVKHEGKDTIFHIGDTAQVMKGKEKADASSLAASTGAAVKIDYVMNGGTRVAEKVEVTAAAHSAHTTPAKK